MLCLQVAQFLFQHSKPIEYNVFWTNCPSSFNIIVKFVWFSMGIKAETFISIHVCFVPLEQNIKNKPLLTLLDICHRLPSGHCIHFWATLLALEM